MTDPAVELHLAVIDEHRRRPRKKGPLPAATHWSRRENPACGDICELRFQISSPENGPPVIVAARYTGAGCAVSQASASLAASDLEGKSVAAATQRVQQMLASVLTPSAHLPADSGEPGALALFREHPARLACARLAWLAAAETLAQLSS